MNEQIQEITKRLEDGIREVFQSDRYKQYLDTMSKFHRYSASNIMLIHQQRPDATCVAGYSSWKHNFGRQVRAGENAIKILAPEAQKVVVEEPILDKNGHPSIALDGSFRMKRTEEYVVKQYKTVSVFDVSQTEGKELPKLCTELDGTVKQYSDFQEAIRRFSAVPIEALDRSAREYGYYSNIEKSIKVREGLSQVHTIKTSIHEVAHSILHDVDSGTAMTDDARTREVQAESIAYTVCQHYGIDTSDYSFNYVAGWSSDKDLTELKESMETIQKTSNDIINGLDMHLKEIQREHHRESEIEGYGISL